MSEKTKANAARRPYRPPQLEEVELVAEEAVLQMCKVPNRDGQFSGSCKGDPPATTKCVDFGT